MSDWGIRITNWNNAVSENLKFIDSLRPSDRIGKGILAALKLVHRMAVANTHVDTSALKHSHRIDFSHSSKEAEGNVYVSDITNPKHALSTLLYGPIEDDRGGDHAFYGLIYNNEGERIAEEAAVHMMRGYF
ncbi:MAG: hypothetical protein JRE40_00050 [Deltaproteobacteria bacterium]|nr:hypothetical protein [Deltaproteobacteria bacterium]